MSEILSTFNLSFDKLKMGSCISRENCSCMYKYKFSYRTKEIKMYRYIVYEGVQFKKSITYEDSRKISKDVIYPYVINDMHTGKFLFTDEYMKPLMCTYSIIGVQNKHSINTDIPVITDIFKDYLTLRDIPKIICSQFSYGANDVPPPAYNPFAKFK